MSGINLIIGNVLGSTIRPGAVLNPTEPPAESSGYVTEDGKVIDTSKNYLTDNDGNLILDSNGNAITI